MEKKFKVEGMHCTSCETLVKEDLEDAGVKVKDISYKKGIVDVSFDEKKVSEDKIKSTIKGLGYKVVG